MLTLLAVTEEGDDGTATAHSTFSTSKTKVSECPKGKGERKKVGV